MLILWQTGMKFCEATSFDNYVQSVDFRFIGQYLGFNWWFHYEQTKKLCTQKCNRPLSLFSSHRKNWFAAHCECLHELHLIKKKLQCLFAWCEFFLIRCKYSQQAANQVLWWLERGFKSLITWGSFYITWDLSILHGIFLGPF